MNQQQLRVVFLCKVDGPSQGVYRSWGKIGWVEDPADRRHSERPGCQGSQAEPITLMLAGWATGIELKSALKALKKC